MRIGVAQDESSPPKNVLRVISDCVIVQCGRHLREVETADVDIIVRTYLQCLLVYRFDVVIAEVRALAAATDSYRDMSLLERNLAISGVQWAVQAYKHSDKIPSR